MSETNPQLEMNNLENEETALFSPYVYITMGIIFFWLILIIDPAEALNNISRYLFYFSIFISAIITLFVASFYSNYKSNLKLSYQTMVYMIIILGVLLRLFYTYYTPYWVRQHDVGTEIDGYGHLSYIYHFATTFELPAYNSGQFYHPPLHHFISGMFIRLFSLLGYTTERTYESLQYLTCFYSSLAIFISYNIFENLCSNKGLRLICLLLVSLNPTFIILSGSINNDMLSILFFLICLSYLIKWYNESTYKNIIIMALALGLGMMAKLSVVMIAPVIAAVFLYKLIKNYNNFNIYKQFLIFGIISIPLGMWHSLLYLYRFKQPLGYVLPLDPASDIYTGNYSFFDRFIFYPIGEFINSPYAFPFEDYNLWGYVVKCFTFGEYTFAENVLFQSWILLIFSALLMLSSVACVFYLIFYYGFIKNKAFFNIMLGIWTTQIISFVYFNIKYPFGCTMDTRYITPAIICGAYFIYLFFETSANIKRQLLINKLFYVLILGFGISSIWFYMLIF